METPKVRFREEPVFLALVLGFPVASGETGAEAISTLKMGSPSSSNKDPVLIVHSGYDLLGLTFVAKFSSVRLKGLSGSESSCSKCEYMDAFMLKCT